MTSHFIYQNFLKISCNTIDSIYLKKSPLASVMASTKLRNLQQAFSTISLSKLVNVAVILTHSSSMGWHEFCFMVQLCPSHNQGSYVARCYGWCSHRNFLIANTRFSCLCEIVQSIVARHRIFQTSPSRSRKVLSPASTWCRSPCWVWNHMGRWMAV